MLDVHTKALAYFRMSPNDPWRWADDGKVLVWSDGTTVVFHEELCGILENIATEDLPPFQGIMILLAACRGKFPTVPTPETAVGVFEHFADFQNRLRQIHELPSRLKNNLKAKAVLVQSVFDQTRVVRTGPAREIIAWLRDSSKPALNSEQARRKEFVNYNSIFHVLHAGLRNFSAEALALRRETGLEALPGAADLDLGPTDRVRALLGKLSNDTEHQGFAKLVRDIMAAIYLPRSISEVDELALGGFSDISNRGSLDRLLPSELAHDDTTLAARIALNEALYLRREPPSNHPPSKAAILIDVGIRQWGLPKVFATAVSLALIAKQERCDGVSIWRAKRDGIEEANLLTRDGLIKHLSVIDTYDHPGRALKSFFSQLAEAPDTEVFLITNRDCLNDPEFQRTISGIDWKAFYISTVDRKGLFTLASHHRWQTPICQAELALESLFSDAKRGITIRDEAQNPDLPLIFATKPFPFLLGITGSVDEKIGLPSGGGIAATKEGKVFLWKKSGHGAETLVSSLPPGRTVWFGTSHSAEKLHILKVHPAGDLASLTSFDRGTQVQTVHNHPGLRHPKRVFQHNDILFLVFAATITAIDLNNGSGLGSIAIPAPNSPSHDKYFATTNGSWSLVCYDGAGLKFQPVQLHFHCDSAHKVLALFDRPGTEGLPRALTDRGEVFSGDGKREINLGRLIKSFTISDDGDRILTPGPAGKDFQLIDLKTSTCPVFSREAANRQLNPPIAIPTCNVRTKLIAIAFTPAGQLFLQIPNGPWLKLAIVDKTIRLVATTEAIDRNHVQPFHEANSSRGNDLKVAIWRDNTKAWRDKRGLLHLKRGDGKVPEVSIVLSNGPMAVWSSAGLICGPKFFLGDQAATDPSVLMKAIQMCAPAS